MKEKNYQLFYYEVLSEWQRLMAEILKQFNCTKEMRECPENFWLCDAIITITHAFYGFFFLKKLARNSFLEWEWIELEVTLFHNLANGNFGYFANI